MFAAKLGRLGVCVYNPTGVYDSGAPPGYTAPSISLPTGFMWIFNRNNNTWQVAVRQDYAEYQHCLGNVFDVYTARFYDPQGNPVTPVINTQTVPASYVPTGGGTTTGSGGTTGGGGTSSGGSGQVPQPLPPSSSSLDIMGFLSNPTVLIVAAAALVILFLKR